MNHWIAALQVGVVAIVAAALLVSVGGPAALGAWIDHSPGWLMDYELHFGPMGRAMPVDQPVGGFYYGPHIATLFAAIETVGLGRYGWWILQLASLWVVHRAGDRMVLAGSGWMRLAFTLTFALSAPLLHNLKWGQVSTPLLALVLAGIALENRGWSGSLLGLAAAVKIYPAIAVGWAGLRGGLGHVGWAAGTLVALYLMPILVLGPEGFYHFWEGTLAEVSRATTTHVPFDANSQYLPYVLGRWGVGPRTGHPAAILGSTLGFLVIVAFAAWSTRRTPAFALASVACSLPLALPTCWTHYLGFLPLVQALIAAEAWRRGSAAAFGVVILSALGASWLMLLSTGTWHVYVAAGIPAVSSLILVGPLWAWSVAEARATRRTPPATTAGRTTASTDSTEPSPTPPADSGG